ncbi:MAG: NADH-quinone oxidoreductase subunit L [Propionibacteriaceae bacterium]|jgi:NADH-quinone oxidoreductase subunit L|nr:NADH-quinone oxidoreductase subunit L [Propionibacteriaceae bacterium]
MTLETLTPVAASGLFSLAWLMIAVPLAMAALLLLAGKAFDSFGHWLAVLASTFSFVVALILFVQLLSADEASRAVSAPMFTWIATQTWTVEAGLLIDPLSILFALLITGVGSLIHLYSVGYMAHDERRRRFFAYLNFFVAAMLLLVLADNYLVLFVGWEGVGLASYLLIGFWQHKPSAAAAAKKAFVMNRVGDLGLTMAVFTMLAALKTSSFAEVNAKIAGVDPAWVTAIGFFLLLAACGKSAQVPLQAWLLDAMEGPTPVSALIHAATMVTAGVYLVVRSHAVYALAPAAQTAVVIVGLVTLFAGAWIGCAKDDIKKVLAGSTMSQIGYMILAAGIGPAGYAFAIFHLLTHGFFKANMFLGAGSVMHAMDDDVNMRHFGALRKALPITFVTFGMGYLAIIGFPGFAGYFSKDSIIEAAFHANAVIGVAAMLGAGVTGFYMTRLMLMTWFGQERWPDGVHPHESPAVMTVPLIVLAVFSVGIGAVLNGWIQEWLAPAVDAAAGEAEWIPSLTGLLTLVVVIAGVALAWYLFGKNAVPAQVPESTNPFTLAGRNDLYGDAVNNALVVRPTMAAADSVHANDLWIIDRGADGLANGLRKLSQVGRRLQSGRVRSYALIMMAGVVLLGALVIVSLLG